MSTYKYTNNKKDSDIIIFEIKAVDIIEADKLFKKVMGYNPSKYSYIGCQIIKEN